MTFLSRWCPIVGLVLWLAGTAVIAIAMSWGIRTEPVRLRLADGTRIVGTLYRSSSLRGNMPAAVVVHGVGVNHQSCSPGLVLPLVRNGYLVLAIDTPGHGQSEGCLPRNELDSIEALTARLTDHPEIDEAIEFLKHHRLLRKTCPPGEDKHYITLIGHSRGGWAVANVGYQRADVDSVVSIGMAPVTSDLTRPHNFLILTGGQEELFPRQKCTEAISQATGGIIREANTPFGNFREGTARRLMLVSRVNHFTELADPAVGRHMVDWLATSLCFRPATGQGIAGRWLILTLSAVIAASLGGLITARWGAGLLVGWLMNRPSLPARPWIKSRLAVLFLVLPGLAPALAWLAKRSECGPVYAAVPSILLFGAVGFLCWALSIQRCRFRPTDHWDQLKNGTARRSLLLAVAALAVSGFCLGLPWELSWAELLPTWRRFVLISALFPFLLPGSLALAQGFQRLAGCGCNCRPAALARGLAWVGIPLTLWFAHHFISIDQWPLFFIPIGFLTVSSFVLLPLWLLPDWKGLMLARAISHAGAGAWLLGCHLPFVHA